MKKTILLIAVAFSTLCSAQVKTTPASKPLKIGKVMNFECYQSEGLYSFKYRDYKYNQIVVYKSFDVYGEDFYLLFDEMVKGFDDIPDGNVTIETENDVFILKYVEFIGIVNLQVFHSVKKNPDVIGVSRQLTKKAVFKLFGVKK